MSPCVCQQMDAHNVDTICATLRRCATMEIVVMTLLAVFALYVSVRFSAAILAIVAGVIVMALSGGLLWAMFVVVSMLSQ